MGDTAAVFEQYNLWQSALCPEGKIIPSYHINVMGVGKFSE